MNISSRAWGTNVVDAPTKPLLATVSDFKVDEASLHACSRIHAMCRRRTDIIQYNVRTSDIICAVQSVRIRASINLDSISTKHGFMVSSHGRVSSPPLKPVFWRTRFFSAMSFLCPLFFSRQISSLLWDSIIPFYRSSLTGTRAGTHANLGRNSLPFDLSPWFSYFHPR